MSTTAACGEQHKLHRLLSSNNNTNNIPPRKLLPTRRAQEYSASTSDSDNRSDNYSPRFSAADESLFRKFLPYNNSTGADEDEDSDDPYSSDHFRMFEFKIRRCSRSRSHDWTDCPFAHPGEKARRRDPRRHHYTGTVCADYRRGSCGRGDSCEFAHGVFECWLHPARYRTEACKDGNNCKRKVCFFAHTQRQLRVLSVQSSSQDHHYQHPNSNNSNNKNKYQLGQLNKHKHCCFFCHPASSPTSTLQVGGHFSSPPMSPPLSPANKQQHCASASNSPLSRYTSSFSATNNFRHSQQYCLLSAAAGPGGLNHDDDQMKGYEDVLAELMTSLEAMKFKTSNNICELANYSSPCSVLPNDIGSPRPNAQRTRWVDVSSINSNIANAANAGGYDHDQDLDLLDQQQQFIVAAAKGGAKGGGGGGSPGNYFSTSRTTTGHGEEEEDHQLYYYCSPPDDDHKQRINQQVNFNFNSPTDPDLGWVNDLLM